MLYFFDLLLLMVFLFLDLLMFLLFDLNFLQVSVILIFWFFLFKLIFVSNNFCFKFFSFVC